MNASLTLALGLCLGGAATVQWSASLDRLPDLRARALVAGAGAFAATTRAGTARTVSLAARMLRDSSSLADATETVSEEEVQAWQGLLDGVAPQAPLPVLTAQAAPRWPGAIVAGAGSAARGGDAHFR